MLLTKNSFNLQLQTITQMYEQASVINDDWVDAAGKITLTDPSQIAQKASITNAYSMTSQLDNQVIVFVHGWRMTTNAMKDFADTMFKRLYWQGYTGRFVAFQWPTEWVDTNSIRAMGDDNKNYDQSEYNAWFSATALCNLLEGLDSQYGYQNVNLLAHSMGNVVASEALRLSTTSAFTTVYGTHPVANAYIASQAAVPAEAYDRTVPMNLRPQAAAYISTLPYWKQVLLQNTLHQDFDTTADVYDNYPGTGQPLFSAISSAATCWNFYNPDDYGLHTWEIDQLYKPDNGFAETPFRYVDSKGFYLGNIPLNYDSNRYTILAFGAQPSSLPLGMEQTGGVFSANVDLSAAPYAFQDAPSDHSAEFNGTEGQRQAYWSKVMTAMGLKHWGG